MWVCGEEGEGGGERRGGGTEAAASGSVGLVCWVDGWECKWLLRVGG